MMRLIGKQILVLSKMIFTYNSKKIVKNSFFDQIQKYYYYFIEETL